MESGTYHAYLNATEAIPFEKMCELHQSLQTEVGRDEDTRELYEDLLHAAVDYAAMRAKWSLMTPPERVDNDQLRTALHDAFLLRLDLLARWLKAQGKPAAWRDALGYESENPWRRKSLGDFACCLAFLSALHAR